MLSRTTLVALPLWLVACQPQLTTLVEGEVEQQGAWAQGQEVHVRSYDPDTNDSARIASAEVWPDGSFSALVPNYDGWMMLEFEDVSGVRSQAVLPPSKLTQRDELRIDYESSLEAGLFYQLDRRDASTHAFVERWVGPLDEAIAAQPHMAKRFGKALVARDNASAILAADAGPASEARVDGVIGHTLRKGVLPMPMVAHAMIVEAQTASEAIATLLDDPRAAERMEAVEAQAVVDFTEARDRDELAAGAERWRRDTREVTIDLLADEEGDRALIDTAFVLGELHREPTVAALELSLGEAGDDALVVALEADRRALEEDLALLRTAVDEPEAVEDILYVWAGALAL